MGTIWASESAHPVLAVSQVLWLIRALDETAARGRACQAVTLQT